MYKYFVVHRGFVVKSLLDSEQKLDVNDLPIADGIKEMLIIRGYTRDKILNTKISSLAENLQIDYYVALPYLQFRKKIMP